MGITSLRNHKAKLATTAVSESLIFTRIDLPAMSAPQSRKERVHAIRRKMGRDAAKLLPHEVRWRDKQPFLASRGYNLRPRYHPDWVPSWDADQAISPLRCEDYHGLPVSAPCPFFAFLQP